MDKEEIKAPREYKGRVVQSLEANNEVIANRSDKELGQIKTVTMQIHTGEHHLLKLRPYRIPFHKRKLVEMAVQEMLDAGLIVRSQSQWSFPIYNVGKKAPTDSLWASEHWIK